MDTPQAVEAIATPTAEQPASALWQFVRSFLRWGTLASLRRWEKTPEPFIVFRVAVIGLVVSSGCHH